jgi:AbrB family looped-hinge helix DNA binding protein
MNMLTKLSAKGQVAIPKDVRDMLGWQKGTSLELVPEHDGVHLRTIVDPVPDDFDLRVEQLQNLVAYDGQRADDTDWHISIDAMMSAKEAKERGG